MSNLEKQHHQTFESIKQEGNNGQEYWSARVLSKVLEYSEYRHFLPVVKRAKEACRNSNLLVQDHFEDHLDMVSIGSDATREVDDRGP
jgi:DNA-damage-inducible protein D